MSDSCGSHLDYAGCLLDLHMAQAVSDNTVYVGSTYNKSFKLKKLCIWMFHVDICKGIACMNACRSRKMVLNSLELELLIAACSCVSAGNQIFVLRESSRTQLLNHLSSP